MHSENPNPNPSETKAGQAPGSCIVIAHRNRFQTDALRLACNEIFPKARVIQHASGNTALQALRQRPADMLLAGLTFDDIDGIEFLRQVCDTPLASRVLIVSEHWDEHVLLSLRTMLFSGAMDLTTESIDAIKRILLHVANGHGYISHTLRRYLIDELPSIISSDELTVSELRVLRVIGDGTDNKDAAHQLGLTESTVRTHRRNIMRKLRVSTSAKLVREAVRLGVVHIPLLMLFKRPHLDVFPRPVRHLGPVSNQENPASSGLP